MAEKNEIVMSSTQKGLVTSYLKKGFWVLAAVAILLLLRWGSYTIIERTDVPDYTKMMKVARTYGYIPHDATINSRDPEPIYENFPTIRKARTLGEYWKYGCDADWKNTAYPNRYGAGYMYSSQTVIGDDFMWWFLIIISGILTLVVLLINAKNLIDTYFKGKEVMIIDKDALMIRDTVYGFPNQKATHDIVFHYVSSVKVYQDSLQAINNTGTIRMYYARKIGAEIQKGSCWIDGIENPKAYQAMIWENLPQAHELDIKTK
jgi:hypothetical protein